MSKLEKAKRRLSSLPSDYTFTEARFLLGQLGFDEFSKGHTSGSRVMFFRKSDKTKILLHQPHPGDQMPLGAIRSLRNELKKSGDL
jgi:hypothetical protein